MGLKPSLDVVTTIILALSCSGKRCYVAFGMDLVKVNVKVKLSLCLTKHHAMKMYWGSGNIAPRILDVGARWR
jgi:hypothetical protein